MQIKRKADGWIVMDDNGMHRFATKEEVDAYVGKEPVVPEEEAPVPEDEDSFDADA